ncbi:hypothetical protein NP493_29g04053 [Ridgeia piscesae]|uniref:Uncharacterized protein n=1 Tax=Ridgeia piscesae TaxID=27915 RepID=A0AAD9UKA6_RIDPI|nr:hypothetical protein NP493_29g04053 [Ridgeia piscesae]
MWISPRYQCLRTRETNQSATGVIHLRLVGRGHNCRRDAIVDKPSSSVAEISARARRRTCARVHVQPRVSGIRPRVSPRSMSCRLSASGNGSNNYGIAATTKQRLNAEIDRKSVVVADKGPVVARSGN